MDTIRENTEALLEAGGDVGLEMNAEKTKCMIVTRHQNSGQNQSIRIANESFENVEESRYFGTTLRNQNNIHDELKSRLNSGNSCYRSVQSLFVFPSHIKELNIKIYRTVILPVILHGCKT
jgi:hypothetical protein